MKTRRLVLVFVATALAAGLLFEVARSSRLVRGDSAGASTGSSSQVAAIEPEGDGVPESAADQLRRDGASNPANASRPASPHALGHGGEVGLADLPAGRLKSDLAQLDPAARARALLAIGELQIPANDANSLHADASGALFYVCSLGHEHLDAPATEAAVRPLDDLTHATASAETFNGVVSIAAVPIRHSRPGSPNKLYLDFTGHTVTGTAWNSRPGGAAVYECRPFNRDFEESTLNWWEREEIVVIWERVAEAFLGFDIDVTTEEPAVFDNRTARAVITHYRDANGVLNPAADASSGVAFLNVFGQPDYAEKHSVFFVYHSGLGSGSIADTIVHEFGHNLGLSHDGDAQREYYLGHDYGSRRWITYMGGGYGTVAQWSKGEYYGANNPQDDLAIIGGKLASVTDDNSGAPGGSVQAVQNGETLLARGVIERTSDSDSFSFSAGPGAATFEMRPEHMPTAYDDTSRQSEIAVELRDSGGAVILQAGPDGTDVVPFTTTLAGGNYTLVVRGVGFGSPLTPPPTGFTAYGSIGRYSVTGTVVPPVAHQSPEIVKNPVSQIVFNGNGVTFEVLARGNPATSYRWQVSGDAGGSWSDLSNGDAITGATTAVLSIGALTIELDETMYRCVVTNAAGTVISAGATLHIRSAPVIVTQPSPQYLNTGDTASFSVAALGSPPLGYQWRKNGEDIPGATGSTLTVSSVTVASAGSYSVVVSNRYGSTTSTSATLGVDTPPQVIGSPQSKGVPVGQDLSLAVTAVGSPPLSYQWRKDGAPIPGATSATLLIPGAGEGDSGQYSVSIGNAFGSATSGAATVVVGHAPSITTQPASAMVLSGSFYSLTVNASGTTPIAYQWSKSGAEIPGATGPTLIFVSASVSDDGVYSVRVSNVIGAVESEPAILTVNVLPRIVVQPVPQSVVVGGAATFTTAASGKPAPTLQWFKDGVAIEGATSASLALGAISDADAGSYHVVATNSVGAAASNHVALTVYPSLQVSGNRVAAGNGYSLFIKEDGSLWGMGRNESGQLGDGTRETRLSPVKITEGVASVAVGPGHSLLIKTDGTLWATGHNGFGQLGDGTNVTKDVPVQIAQGVVAAVGGGGHSLFIKSDGTLWAMGYGANGQLGNGGTTNQWTPVQVATSVMAVSAGNLHTLFVKLDGTAWAVGYNNRGQTMGGSAFNVLVPVHVGSGIVEVSAGLEHSLLLHEAGAVIAFGRNSEGQFGNGTWQGGQHPVQVAVGVAAISAGGDSSTFIREDGTLLSMGSNSHGQLGRGGRQDVPGQVAEGVVGAAISATHMIFVGLDSTVWTSGNNEHGQLGDGLTVSRSVPLRIYPPSPPRITFQPEDQYGRAGSPVTFEIEAIGPEGGTFQWLKDGAEISGATGAALTVSEVTEGTLGMYTVVVTNPWGSAISAPATLHWMDPVPVLARSVAAGASCNVFIRPDGTAWGTGTLGEPDSGVPRFLSSDAVSVAAGDAHALILKSDGTLLALGANANGQLGDGTQVHQNEPVQISTDVAVIAVKGNLSGFVKSDGTFWTMGTETSWQGHQYSTPALVGTGVTSIESLGESKLFLRADGALWGTGSVTLDFDPSRPVYTSRPIRVASDVRMVSSLWHTLFLKADGSLHAFGWNGYGQLGDGTFETRTEPILVTTGVESAAVGGSNSVFLRTDGSLWGMGSNGAGELGQSGFDRTSVPVLMATSVEEMAAGPSGTIYRAIDGSVWATGFNSSGQIGDGGDRARFEFFRVDPPAAPTFALQPVREYGRPGSTVVFRAKGDGRPPLVYQWRRNGAPILGANSDSLVLTNVGASDFGTYSVDASNEFGAVASDTFEFVSIPPILPKIAKIAAGNIHSFFLKGGGTLWAMGSNSSGQLGNGTNVGSPVPTLVQEGVLSIAAGAGHSLILKSDRSLWAAGWNANGQLGDGTTIDRHSPVKVADDVALMAAGNYHSLFVKADGTLWAMGSNYHGQLGDGTSASRYSPVPVATGVTAVSVRGENGYFVRRDGTLWRLGNQGIPDNEAERDLPQEIASEVVDVAAGAYLAVFLKADGSMWATGTYVRDYFTNLPPPDGSDAPLKVAEGVSRIAAGDGHVLFVKTDGSLWATGGNEDGKLGDGTNERKYAPVQIASGVAEIAASYANSAFLKQDGTVWMMGDNQYGQLGVGSNVDSWTPVQSGTINELRINSQPASKAVVQGQAITLSVGAAGFPTPTYQWLKDGVPIPGATSPTLTIANAGSSDAGKYSVVVTNSSGSFTSSVASLFVTPDPSTSRLINVSTRAFAGSGGGTLTVGFTIVGTGQKTVAIRGVGPKLADFNVPVVVDDPELKLYKIDGTLIAENDDWESVVAANAGGFSLPPGSKDAALEVQLPPGGYTVQLINPGALAEGMIEVYDISQDPGSRLVNLSCRMDLAPGQIVIVGTALSGSSRPIIVRNSGPSLAQYLNESDRPHAATDPLLRFYDSHEEVVGENDDWNGSLAPYFSVIGAFPLADGGKDASQRVVIAPGLNTVHASAKGEAGIVLIELYESP